MIRLLFIAIGYFFGCIQMAFIVGKMKGIDLRKHGSGNLGTTNAFRILGKKLGIIVYIGDVSKTIFAYFLSFLLAKYLFNQPENLLSLYGLYAGLGVVLGHNYPFYLKFKGGKGIAVTSGIMLSIDPIATVIIVALMFLIIYKTKYVSLGSILGMVTMFLWVLIEKTFFNCLHDRSIEFIAIIGFLALLGIIKHRANIKRILKGCENKIGGSKK